MPGLPPLNGEDVQVLDTALDDFLRKSEALTALIIDKGGPLLSQRGEVARFDTTTISALAAGAFSATEAIAGIISENGFSNIYQQGEKHSLLFCNIDGDLLLIIIFKAEISVGAIKYFAAATVGQVAAQIQKARERAPEEMVDLVSMNMLDAGSIFRQSPESNDPVVFQKSPIVQAVEPGTYWWCACGRSATQPFCDGSHKGTTSAPVKVQIDAKKTVAWCGCKHSKNMPFCDGSHGSL